MQFIVRLVECIQQNHGMLLRISKHLERFHQNCRHRNIRVDERLCRRFLVHVHKALSNNFRLLTELEAKRLHHLEHVLAPDVRTFAKVSRVHQV